MMKVINSFVVVLALLNLLRVTQGCKKSCNGNGFCYVENEIEKCKCLDRIYVGESCEKLVNYCDVNPCKNGGQCVSKPGQYTCICTGSNYGQNCTSNKKLFGQVYLLYNHITPIGTENDHFLLILTDLGTVESMIEIDALDYPIASGLTIPSDKRRDFLQTNNIQAIAKKFKVPTIILPSSVYYHVGKYRMASDGIASVTLTISDASEATLYYKWDFQFGSKKNVGCNPLTRITNCGVPRSPVHINVNQSVFLEANINRDCESDSTISYKWSISNYFDTKTLQTFNVSSRSLRIPAFGIQIRYDKDDVFAFLNIIKLVSLEKSADGTRYGESIKRCYILIITDKPMAKITGGEHQEYSYNQSIVMDGSDSVDLSLHPKKNQNLLYLWQCSSNGGDLEYCKNLNESAIPATQPTDPHYFN